MTPVPFDLPLRPSEASELANLIFDQAEGKPLTDEIRNRVASRVSVVRFQTIRPYFGSLERDPVHPSVYYVAVDGENGTPLLLHMALATAPTSSIFYKPLLIGRMRRLNGPEMVINALPFGPGDCEQLEMFCTRIDSAFLPRPQGLRAAISVSSAHPERVLPESFSAFRSILKRTGKNLASIEANGSTPARELYYAGLWTAIRAGWRDGYNAGVEIAVLRGSVEEAKEAIRGVVGFSTFALDGSSLFRLEADARLPGAWSDEAVAERFEDCFTAGERGWIFDEFVRAFAVADGVYDLTSQDVVRLAVKFGAALGAMTELHQSIREARSALKAARPFDFEVSLDRAGAPSTAQEVIFCLQWLKQRGHAAQLIAPTLAHGEDLASQLRELAGIARHFQAKLSFRGPVRHSDETLDLIGRATMGRVHYAISGEGADVAALLHRAAEHLTG